MVGRDAAADGALRPVLVSTAQLGDSLDVLGRLIGRLVSQVAFDVSACAADRVSRADGGVGGHRRHMRRHGYERTGGRGARSCRRDVDDDGDSRILDPLDDVAHGRIKAARRVEADDDGGRVGVFSSVDAPVEVAGHDRVDIAVGSENVDRLAGVD